MTHDQIKRMHGAIQSMRIQGFHGLAEAMERILREIL